MPQQDEKHVHRLPYIPPEIMEASRKGKGAILTALCRDCEQRFTYTLEPHKAASTPTTDYDSLETNPIKNTGLDGEIEMILRGYETVADGEGNPKGFDLNKDGRTQDGFYWEFDDIAEAAKEIALHVSPGDERKAIQRFENWRQTRPANAKRYVSFSELMDEYFRTEAPTPQVPAVQPFEFVNKAPEDKEWTSHIKLLNGWTPADRQLRHIVHYIRSGPHYPADMHVDLIEQLLSQATELAKVETEVRIHDEYWRSQQSVKTFGIGPIALDRKTSAEQRLRTLSKADK